MKLVFHSRLREGGNLGLIGIGSPHLTVFITPWGFYQWVQIPLDLMNATTHFNAVRKKCYIPSETSVAIHTVPHQDIKGITFKDLDMSLDRPYRVTEPNDHQLNGLRNIGIQCAS